MFDSLIVDIPSDIIERTKGTHYMLEQIRELLHAEPFARFRIILNSGKEYLVINPDLLAIGESQINLFAPKSDHWSIIRINQISSIDILPNQAA